MSDSTKMTHPTAATVERVEAGAGLAGASTSDSQSTTSAPPGQAVKIADLLGHGQSAAVPLRHLKELAGLPGREVRRMIEAERRAGALIISDNRHGYFLADTQEEVNQFVKSMLRRSGEIARTARMVGQAAEIGGE